MTLSTFVVAGMLLVGLGGLIAGPGDAATLAPSADASLGDALGPGHSATYRISVGPTLGESGDLRFTVQEGDYSNVVISQRDHSQYRFVGNYATHVHAPSGDSQAFMAASGGGYTSPVGGSAYVGSGLGASIQLPYEAGLWRVSYDVRGSLELGFEVTVS